MVGATAYACTTGGGDQTFTSPSSGTHGTLNFSVTTYASGGSLTSGTYFFRYSAPGGVACHHATPIGGGVAEVGGNIASASSPLTRVIPNLGGSKGQTGLACWATGNHVNSEIALSAKITLN